MHRVFIVGICKWIAGLAVGQNVQIEVKSVHGYTVYKGAPTTDLVSIAIKFVPQDAPARDPLNLAKIVHAAIDECALGVQALRRVAKHLDVDGILRDKKDIFEKMREDMCALLEAARYDRAAYLAWLEKGA